MSEITFQSLAESDPDKNTLWFEDFERFLLKKIDDEKRKYGTEFGRHNQDIIEHFYKLNKQHYIEYFRDYYMTTHVENQKSQTMANEVKSPTIDEIKQCIQDQMKHLNRNDVIMTLSMLLADQVASIMVDNPNFNLHLLYSEIREYTEKEYVLKESANKFKKLIERKFLL